MINVESRSHETNSPGDCIKDDKRLSAESFCAGTIRVNAMRYEKMKEQSCGEVCERDKFGSESLKALHKRRERMRDVSHGCSSRHAVNCKMKNV